ncbi:hypothetical protein TNCV_3720861 [Trichonephila clavipes]|nr:hypothetical protein TNCV_3720861 [Trichonephila clavipes]
MTSTAGSDVVQSGCPIFDDFFNICGRISAITRRMLSSKWIPQKVTRSTIRADVRVAIVPQTISRHISEANLKSTRPFRALPLTPEHRQLHLQW